MSGALQRARGQDEGVAYDETTLPSWVLHDHRVPRPHRDLRLERDGVLVSWAVPRGLPTDPTGNRLAVHVPDHDLDHLTYTDATKSVEDTGVYVAHEWLPRKVLVTLQGRAATATYALIATRAEDWILHRLGDADPRHRAAALLLAELAGTAQTP